MNRGVIYYILGRFLQSVMVLWVIVTLLFLLFRLAPAQPAGQLYRYGIHQGAGSGADGPLRPG